MRPVPTLFAASVLVLGVSASSAAADTSRFVVGGSAPSGVDGEQPTVVVTTNILGDIVSEVLGDEAAVEVIMPLGSDPHDFAASARQAESMEQADLLVVNGAGFEEGLLDIIASAEGAGAPVFAFSDHVDLLEFTGDHGHDDEEGEHADEEGAHDDEEGEHADEEGAHDDEDGDHSDEDGAHDDEEGEHDDAEGSDDPHIWTDPSRMAGAVTAFAERAAEIEGVDADVIASQAASYVDELEALDAEIDDRLGDIPAEQRVLVTNHEVLGYFADRYDFEVIGAVIPSLTTNASASAAAVEDLAALIAERGVPAIFAETTQPTQLAEVLAEEAGNDVDVVELYTESLGEGGSGAETYLGMMRLNAERIAEALS